MASVFDYGSLLKRNEVKHKQKPLQFSSVSGGVQQRLKLSIQNRKSSRFLVHDNARDLEKCTTAALPSPKSEAQIKMEHRKAQLEKWREAKKQKKKEEASHKKKPFLAGIPKNPLTFVPPPPLIKPSTSGRVTRSQTRSTVKPKPKSPVKSNLKSGNSQSSFAPKHATFKPPEFINLAKLPKLAPVSKSKNRNATTQWSFAPVVQTTNTEKRSQNPSTSTRQNVTEKKNTRPVMETRSTRGRFTKRPSPKKVAKHTLSSNSSESDIEPKKLVNRIQTPGARKNLKKQKDLTPKLLVMQSTSSEIASGCESDTPSRRKSARKSMRSEIQLTTENTFNALRSEDSQSSSETSSEEKSMAKVDMRNRRTLANNFIIPSCTSDSSVEKSPMVVLNRSLPCTPGDKPIPRSESSSEEKLRLPRADVDVLTPEQKESAKISPCVTMTRGKENARREMKWKIDEGLLDDDASDMVSVDYFRKQLSSEIKRLTELCEIWDKISTQSVLPEAVQEAVLAAVGQARLLISSKLQQFGGLVERCAHPAPGAALVTPADLRGFWDMVFIQVSNVDLRFKKLEETRARNWREEEPKPAADTRKTGGAKPKGARGAKPKGGGSRIKDVIAAFRKALKEKHSSSEDSSPVSVPSPSQEKTFEAGFFCVRSPVRPPRAPGTPAPATPAGNILLKAVLSNEAKKASASKLTPQMTPIYLLAAPSRSILKSANGKSARSERKSVKTVLFNDSSEESNLNNSFVRDSAISGIMALEKTMSTESENTEQVVEEKNTRILRSTRQSERKSLQNISNIQDSTETRTPKSASKKKINTNETSVIEIVTPVTAKSSSKRGSSKKSSSKKSKKADLTATPIDEKRKRLQRQKGMEDNVTEVILAQNQTEELTPANKQSGKANKALEEIEIVTVEEQSPSILAVPMSSTNPSLRSNKALEELEKNDSEVEPASPTTALTEESASTITRSVRKNKALKELEKSGFEVEPSTPRIDILEESTTTSKRSVRKNKALKELEKSDLEVEPTTPKTDLLEVPTSTNKKSVRKNREMRGLDTSAVDQENVLDSTSKRSSRRKKAVC